MLLFTHLSYCQAEFVPTPDPSLTEQYEYANEHGIKCLVIITDTDFSLTGSVKVMCSAIPFSEDGPIVISIDLMDCSIKIILLHDLLFYLKPH